MDRKLASFALVVLAVFALAGCRIKAVESYQSANTPNPVTPAKGDPYSASGSNWETGGVEPAKK